MREFDDVEVVYSSMTYVADVSRITRYSESGKIVLLDTTVPDHRFSYENICGDRGVQHSFRGHR
jgi:hypothetical protein